MTIYRFRQYEPPRDGSAMVNALVDLIGAGALAAIIGVMFWLFQ